MIKVSEQETWEVSTLVYTKLRKIRNSKDISAREMADLLGLMTEAAYYKKESGATKFSIEETKKIALMIQSIKGAMDALGVENPEQLLAEVLAEKISIQEALGGTPDEAYTEGDKE